MKDKDRFRKAIVALAGVVVSLFCFILYLRTLAPTVLPLTFPDMPDSDMLQMQTTTLSMTHPTGYPSYLMLTHLFTYLPFGDEAYRSNLASAVYAALAVALVYASGYLLSRKIIPAAAGALAFGIGGTLWSQAVITEVYTLNAFFISLTIFVLLVWRRTGRDRYLFLAAFCVGLSMTNHLTSGILLPGAFLFVAVVNWRKLVQPWTVVKGLGSFALALSLYLYLPIRAAMDPPMSVNNPTTLGRFWWLVSGGDLRGTFLSFGPAGLVGRLDYYWRYLSGDYNWWLVAAGAVGFAAMLLWDRKGALLLGSLSVGWLFFALEDNIPDIHLYFIPTYLILSLWIAVGFGVVLEDLEALASRLGRIPRLAVVGVLSVVLLLLPLPGITKAYAENDVSNLYRGQRTLNAVAKDVAPNATILHHRSLLWYMVLVEHRRQDLTIVDPFYRDHSLKYNDIVWPDPGKPMTLKTTDRLYGTQDPTGVAAAKMALKKGPVYILYEPEIRPKPFYKNFKVVHVKDRLYRLLPKKDNSKPTG